VGRGFYFDRYDAGYWLGRALYRSENGKLINAWIREHDGGHIVAAKPLLVMEYSNMPTCPTISSIRGSILIHFSRTSIGKL